MPVSDEYSHVLEGGQCSSVGSHFTVPSLHGEGYSCWHTFQGWCEPTYLFSLCSGLPPASLAIRGTSKASQVPQEPSSPPCSQGAASWGLWEHLLQISNPGHPKKLLKFNSRSKKDGKSSYKSQILSQKWKEREYTEAQQSCRSWSHSIPSMKCSGLRCTQSNAQSTSHIHGEQGLLHVLVHL